MSYFDDLDSDFNSGKVSKEVLTDEQIRERASMVNGGETGYEAKPCPKCGGRGSKTYGYVNIRSYPCGLCKGTGKVTGRRLANVERFKKGLATQASNLAARREAFIEKHGDFLHQLEHIAGWSDFARSLVSSFAERGTLTEKQIEAGKHHLARIAEKRAQKAAEANAKSGEVEMSAISALFDKARSSGLKRPKFYVGEMKISLAPLNGRNAGALYVMQGEEYQGKIANGTFQAVRSAKPETLEVLREIAKNPGDAARMYGQKTGICCCCGAELTNAQSIAAGIGPICAGNWGL